MNYNTYVHILPVITHGVYYTGSTIENNKYKVNFASVTVTIVSHLRPWHENYIFHQN